MREFNKIHVIALPRCATVSMCDGLGALGIVTAHLGKFYGEQTPEHHNAARLIRMHQQISVGDYDLDILNHCRGLADYPACIPEVISALDLHYPGSLFINIRRDSNLQAWLQSAERQFIGLRIIKTTGSASEEDKTFADAMADFRRMTFGQSAFDPEAFTKAYDRHQAFVRDYFQNRQHDLLDIPDIELLRDQGFELLCNFLDHAPQKILFPCKNEHSSAPQQAFMNALRDGKIKSQTGIVPE